MLMHSRSRTIMSCCSLPGAGSAITVAPNGPRNSNWHSATEVMPKLQIRRLQPFNIQMRFFPLYTMQLCFPAGSVNLATSRLQGRSLLRPGPFRGLPLELWRGEPWGLPLDPPLRLGRGDV